MATKKVINTYIPGAWNVICDRCGTKRKNFQCTMQMIPERPNLFVCTDTCLDKHNPQFDVTGVQDLQAVPVPRPDSNSNAQNLGAFAPGYSAPITAANVPSGT